LALRVGPSVTVLVAFELRRVVDGHLRHPRRDLAGIRGGIEVRDGTHAAHALEEVLPGRGERVPDRRYDAEPGDYDDAFGHYRLTA
jgi:hypothetical protein